MNTKLLDLDDVRRKEAQGAVPRGTADALVERAQRLDFATGTPAYAVDHTWWRKQIGAPPKQRQRHRGNARRRLAIPGPGTTLACLIKLVTLGFVRPCTGCRSRARRLDRIGWRGMFYGTLGLLGVVDRRWGSLRR